MWAVQEIHTTVDAIAAVAEGLIYRDPGRLEDIKTVVLSWVQSKDAGVAWTDLLDAAIDAAHELQG